MALWIIATSLVGFVPTLIYRYTASPSEPMAITTAWHGALFSLWVLLFAAQVWLVGQRRLDLHRKLGLTSLLLLIVMIPSGFHTVLRDWAVGISTAQSAGFGLAQLTLGFALAFAGIGFRRNAFVHKRLMMCGAIALTFASADRTAWELGFGEIRELRRGLCVLPIAALAIYDVAVWRRVPWIAVAVLITSWSILVLFITRPFFSSPAGALTLETLAVLLGVPRG